MSSNESTLFPINANKKKTSRRSFITRSAGCTAGLILIGIPETIAEVREKKGDKTKEEIYKELEEKAQKYMSTLGTCSQSSFCSLNEQFGLKGDEIIPALKPFAGGIAGKGETCGAVSGSLLALGLHFEALEQNPDDQTISSFKYAGLFFDKFKEEFGSTRCSEVVEYQYGRKYDFLNPEDMKLFMEAAKSGKCIDVVKKAVQIAAGVILENS